MSKSELIHFLLGPVVPCLCRLPGDVSVRPDEALNHPRRRSRWRAGVFLDDHCRAFPHSEEKRREEMTRVSAPRPPPCACPPEPLPAAPTESCPCSLTPILPLGQSGISAGVCGIILKPWFQPIPCRSHFRFRDLSLNGGTETTLQP